MRLEPITWELLTRQLADHLAADLAGQLTGPPASAPAAQDDDRAQWLRVAVDGAPPAEPGALAERLADAVRLRGMPALVVGTDGFLRADSLRFEFGKQDPDAYYDLWYDTQALWREVFAPLDPGGDGRVLPDLRAPTEDRPTRSPYVQLPAGGVLLLHGPFLLGKWFPFDLTVHLGLSASALERLTPYEEHWKLPAYERYEDEVAPQQAADVFVRSDRPQRPAWSGLPGRD
ncbi:uridine kinase [Streptomyces marispadix]|uniref:Uridine kinase n=1 Tax=Streptomyces marispadix TaxID=2922868 RepID=A0ABS9STT3_9ACTN|nr:uridine kinase [Streptomyces marispadix]MCH6159677.1 uridine kinase [Streptomyces marispadix]